MTQTDDVFGLVRDVFGGDLIGVYLHGSTALDAMRPHSDLDILVVIRRRTTEAERRELGARLLRVSGRRAQYPDARPVELTVVAQSEVRPWRYPPRMELQYGEWLRADFEAGRIPEPAPNPDLAALLTMVLRADRPVFGSPAAEVLDPVPHEDLQRAIVEGVPGLFLDLETDTANVLLTLARVWVTLVTGDILSKEAAADWAIERVTPEVRKPLALARSVYLGEDRDEGWDELVSMVRACADSMRGAITALSESTAIPVSDAGLAEP